MLFSIEHLQSIILNYRYVLLFPIAVFEGPIVTMLAGFLISQGYLDFWLTYTLIVVGDEVGDILHYAVGAWGGMSWIKRVGQYIGISDAELAATKRVFEQRGKSTILFSKVLHGVGGMFQFVAGAVGMPFGQFVGYTFIGTVIKALVLLLVGFYFGQSITKIDAYFDYIALAGVMSIIGVFLVLYVRKFLQTEA